MKNVRRRRRLNSSTRKAYYYNKLRTELHPVVSDLMDELMHTLPQAQELEREVSGYDSRWSPMDLSPMRERQFNQLVDDITDYVVSGYLDDMDQYYSEY